MSSLTMRTRNTLIPLFLTWCMTRVGAEDEQINLEPVEYLEMEWGLANIIVLVVGIGVMLSMVIIGAYLAIFKPHEHHIGRVYREDGTIDMEETDKKRVSLGKKPSFKKILSKKKDLFNLLVEENGGKPSTKNSWPLGDLKQARSRDRRKAILNKSKNASQHMPEMLEKDREQAKSTIKNAAKLTRKPSSNSLSSKGNSYNALNA